MAKEKDKAAKAAPDEQLVEKPREPMFSTAGMIVFAGSLVLCAVVVFVAGMFIFGGGDEGEPKSNASDDAGMVDPNSIEILSLDGITANVPVHGGPPKAIRFNLNIQFDGTPEARTSAMEWVNQKDRKKWMIQMANEVMSHYEFGTIQDVTFKRVFEQAYRSKFNTAISGHRIRAANIYNESW